MTSLAAIQSWPEVPALAHFCSLFKTAFDLLEFEIEELETALVSVDSAQEDMFACTLLERLVVRLLRGCLPATIAAQVHEGNFSLYLRQLLETKQEEAEEEGQMYSFKDPFQDSDVEEFEELSAHSQVRVVCQLTQFRLEAGDAGERLRDLDPDGMRVEPLGQDSEGVTYWYFFGVRLYKEVGQRKPKKARKKKEDKDQQDCNSKQSTAKAKQSKKKKGAAEAVEDAAGGLLGYKVEEEEEVEEEEVAREAPGWYVACDSEADWTDLTARYKKSKKKSDRELYEVLAENFLPEITKMFQEKERQEKIKVMMMNKRSSGRLDRKREEKEKEFEERRQEEEQRELERRAEEEKRRKREKENKLKGRSERAQKRDFVPSEEPVARLLANRKRGREEGVRGGDSVRDVVEEDHDYTRRRNPALREWQRLASSDKEEEGEGREGRSLRL